MTANELVNLALYHLGSQPLSNYLTDNTQAGPIARAWFETARDEMLRSHTWNFATKRKKLQVDRKTLSGSAVGNNSGLFEITYTAHGLETGDKILIENVEGVNINGTHFITKIDADNFTLDDSTFSSGYSSGTGSFVKIPVSDWQYEFTAPTDLLRIISLEDINDEFSFENGKILARDSEIFVKYVSKVTDVSLWPADFCNAFSFLLASYMAKAISSDNEFNYREIYEKMIAPMTKVRDSREGREKISRRVQNSNLLRSRF